ncbi:MAG: DUF1640 domain-containing protein [Magnetococcales bacterium]|nr:DUF1640 domain-containing protein [Magnetococcales bacterium]MBF0156766.1 DUF1640 domain-containing protein [Magnetococcales bacterium]
MMTTAVAFDTHKFVRRLRDAGVEEGQAEAFSDAFQEVREAQLEELATKSDLTGLKSELKGEIAELRSELKGDIRELRGEVERLAEFTSREFKRQEESTSGGFKRQEESISERFKRQEEILRRDIREFRLEIEARLQKSAGEALLLRWMFGFLLAGVISIILKLFLPP